MVGVSRKIGLFVCHDPFGLEITNALAPKLIELGYEPVLFNTRTQRNRGFKVQAPKDVVFYNTYLTDQVVIPFLESSRHRSNPVRSSCLRTYKQLAQQLDCEYHEIEDVNAPKFVQQVNDDCDLVGAISLRFLQVFEHPVIDAFKSKGFMLNLHGGLLPEYKGLLIPAWAIINGDREYGCTLHELSCGIDEGRIISSVSLPIDNRSTIMKHYEMITPKAIEMVSRYFEQKGDDHYSFGMAQAEIPDSYYAYPTEDELNRANIRYSSPFEAVDYYVSRFGIPSGIMSQEIGQYAALTAFETDLQARFG